MIWQLITVGLAIGGAVAWRRLRHVRLPGPTWAWEVGSVAAAVLLAAVPLILAWLSLAPTRAPMGPDSSNYLGCALAFETGRWELYFDDRYPAYPYLVALFARGGPSVPTTGTALSMALTALTALPLYVVGRLLAGRVAGIGGAVLGLRQAVVLDAGRTFTHYPLSGLLDAGLLAAGIGLARTGSPWCAWGLASLAGMAIAADPKQLPLAMATLLVAVGFGLVRPRPYWQRAQLVLAALLPLPVTHWLVGRYRLGLLSLEGIAVRTPMNFVEDLSPHMEEGFALGEPGALGELVSSYSRVLGAVAPKGDGLDPSFLNALPMHFPSTSPLWALLLLLLPAALLWRREIWRVGALLLVLLQVAAASSVMRLHYAHRYALPHLEQVPVVALAGVSLAAGPLAAAGLAAGWLLPGAPMSDLDNSYQSRQAQHTDNWVGREVPAELYAVQWTDKYLEADAVIYDMSGQRPMPILAASREYVRCTATHDTCGQAMSTATTPIVALVWADDFISGQLPSGPRETITMDTGHMPTTLGDCWSLLTHPQPGSGLYSWTCTERPGPWPDVRHAPRAPSWKGAGESEGRP